MSSMIVDKRLPVVDSQVLGDHTNLILDSDSTALMKAVSKGKVRLTRLLVEGGTDVNKQDDHGRTALMFACMLQTSDIEKGSQLKLVKYLLINSAKPNISDKNGQTALMCACISKCGFEIVRLLLDHDADPRCVDKTGASALVFAVDAGDTDVLTLLVDVCKAQGREVIIITTKERGERKRETKQYLDVPPTLVKSPPLFKSIAPRDIEFKLPTNTNNFSTEVERNEYEHPEKNANDNIVIESESCLEPDVLLEQTLHLPFGEIKHKLHSPLTNSLTNNVPSTRRLRRRGSINQSESGGCSPVLTEMPENEGDIRTSLLPSSPVVYGSQESVRRASPRSIQRPLRRRQSSDNFQLDTFNIGSENGSNSSVCSSCHSITLNRNHSLNNSPEPMQARTPPKGISNRRRSLPGMPPPLRKSQTVHAINVPRSIIENSKVGAPARSCPEDLQNENIREESSDISGSWDSSLSTEGRRTASSVELSKHQKKFDFRKKLLLQRRGSAPFMLEDELSQKRPGFLPPLKINPDKPIPDIGCTFTEPFNGSPRFSRLDRRFSIQAEDISKLTNLYNKKCIENNKSLKCTESKLEGKED